MTDKEADLMLADMVRERRALRLSIVCMEQKLDRAGEGFRAAAEATRSSKDLQAGRRVYFPKNAAYPDIEAFRALLNELESAKSRFHELTQRLDTC